MRLAVCLVPPHTGRRRDRIPDVDLHLALPVPPRTSSPNLRRERQLVDRCVAGEAGGWDELYAEFHRGLLFSIRRYLGSRKRDRNLVEEIAARVWYALVADGARQLDRFDVNRGWCLSTYLASFAKREAVGWLRAERCRQQHEGMVSRREANGNHSLQGVSHIDLYDFLQTLTPREHEFVYGFLLRPIGEGSGLALSDANRWQLVSRIRRKLQRFLHAETAALVTPRHARHTP